MSDRRIGQLQVGGEVFARARWLCGPEMVVDAPFSAARQEASWYLSVGAPGEDPHMGPEQVRCFSVDIMPLRVSRLRCRHKCPGKWRSPPVG